MDFYVRRGKAVKIFISWSGERSKKIAVALRKWIKRVIQSVEPYVSSEDIPKGMRWSGDIANELQDTNFGILCVTRDNFEAPWLLFEAGALSKTIEKSHVVPFLFDLKPSDLSDSPLMQFQATPFSKEEIKKLIKAIDNANETKLDELDMVFEKWYPDLEKELMAITADAIEENEATKDEVGEKSSQVLEEILSLARDNQNLLRQSESRSSEELGEVIKMLERISYQHERSGKCSSGRIRKIHPMTIREIFYGDRKEMSFNYGFLIMLSFFKNDYPWVYDIGKELYDLLKREECHTKKDKAVRNFVDMLEQTSHNIKKFNNGETEDEVYLRELPMMLAEMLEREAFVSSLENKGN